MVVKEVRLVEAGRWSKPEKPGPKAQTCKSPIPRVFSKYAHMLPNATVSSLLADLLFG